MSVVGVVLAGGGGRRIGGDKATVEFRGDALLLHPLRALTAVSDAQAIVAKRATRLPPLPAGVRVWREPEEPRHPLTGVLHALRSAAGRPVLCCAVDLPLLDAATLSRLLGADDGRHACVVPRLDGILQPLCAVWYPRAERSLVRLPGGVAMRDVVGALDAREVPFDDPRPFTNVNTPEDLESVEAFTRQAQTTSTPGVRQPNVKA